jgi:hypothetical protein
MKNVQEERAKVASENEQLHQQIQYFINEIKIISAELETFKRFFTLTPEQQQNPDQIVPDVIKMKNKVEELEDAVQELKQQEGAYVVIEQREIIAGLELSIGQQNRSLEELKQKLIEYLSK